MCIYHLFGYLRVGDSLTVIHNNRKMDNSVEKRFYYAV